MSMDIINYYIMNALSKFVLSILPGGGLCVCVC